MNINDELLTLLAFGLLNKDSSSESLSTAKFQTLTNLLVNKRIPFDVSYSTGSRRESPSVELKIYITPSLKILIDIDIDNNKPSYNQ